jgi:hypothetical protein
MATAGTLLSDLDSKSPVFNKDDDLVNKILADMNMPSSSNPVMNSSPSLPPPSGTGRVIQAPNPNSTYPTAIDPGTATAHMIGKDYPTAADFSNLMHASPMSHGGSSFASIPSYTAPPSPSPTLLDTTKGNIYSDILLQVKQPLLVSIIIFIVNLPIINVLLGHYIPTLLRIGGDLTTAGMAVKAFLGGFLFWFIQKVLVPLMVV